MIICLIKTVIPLDNLSRIHTAPKTMAKKTTTKKTTKAKAPRATKASANAKNTPKTVKEVLTKLESLGNEGMRAYNAKGGAGDNQFGVKLGDIRVLANQIKTNHELALALWKTGNVDAQHLATLLIQPKKLSADEMDRMVRSITFVRVADWLISYVVKQHPDKETLRQKWMATDDRWAARAGWSLTAGAGREESGRARPRSAARSHRVRNGQRRSCRAMDDERRVLRKSASTLPNSASEPSPSARSWESIATIPCRKVARHLSPRSGSTLW